MSTVKLLKRLRLSGVADGDIGAIFGFGFPAFCGGPLRYIDHRGAASTVTDLERYASRLGDWFVPASPLVEMARTNRKLYR